MGRLAEEERSPFGGLLESEHDPHESRLAAAVGAGDGDELTGAELQVDSLEDALARNRFNQRATAAAIGLSYDQLRHALKRHKLLDAGN